MLEEFSVGLEISPGSSMSLWRFKMTYKVFEKKKKFSVPYKTLVWSNGLDLDPD